MKFFHLSDLHIGLKLYKYDLTEDQLHIFRQIAEERGISVADLNEQVKQEQKNILKGCLR